MRKTIQKIIDDLDKEIEKIEDNNTLSGVKNLETDYIKMKILQAKKSQAIIIQELFKVYESELKDKMSCFGINTQLIKKIFDVTGDKNE